MPFGLAEPWADTATSTGRLMIAVPGGLADVERDFGRTRSTTGGPMVTHRPVRMMLVIVGALAALQIIRPESARAEQVIARHIEYSNDSISDRGKTVACVVTLVVESPPDQRTLNFRFLSLNGRAGWKITGGKMDWSTQTMTALRAQDGSFSSSSFVATSAFEKDLTPEGQLVGVLTRPDQLAPFTAAFFTGPYTVAVKWEGSPDEQTYYVADPPPTNIKTKFLTCMKAL
jgi:hypothetical protein